MRVPFHIRIECEFTRTHIELCILWDTDIHDFYNPRIPDTHAFLHIVKSHSHLWFDRGISPKSAWDIGRNNGRANTVQIVNQRTVGLFQVHFNANTEHGIDDQVCPFQYLRDIAGGFQNLNP